MNYWVRRTDSQSFSVNLTMPSDTFLPFDLESCFSAALVMVMASSVHPKLLPQENWLETYYGIFDYMIKAGNGLAVLRKAEVGQLAQIKQRFHNTRPSQPNRSVDNPTLTPFAAAAQTSPVGASIPDGSSLPSLGDPFFNEWIADDGFSGAQIMDLVDALNFQDLA